MVRDNKPLVDRLRGFEYLSLEHICVEAADEIERLQKEIEQLNGLLDELEARADGPEIIRSDRESP